MKRIGLLSLALVLALGALGVGYAAWTEQVTIEGTVDTGSLKLGIGKADITIEQEKEIASANLTWEGEIGEKDLGPPIGFVTVYEKLIVTIEDAYPCIYADIAFYVANMGSIPLHISALRMYDPTGELEFKWDPLPPPLGNDGYFYDPDDPDQEPVISVRVINLIGTQLHYCQSDKADLILKFEQPAKQGHTYSFMLEVEAIQWNKDQGPR
ncbi:MAG: hypothetical protein R6U93_02020 [Dehalococcoidia bacterium]